MEHSAGIILFRKNINDEVEFLMTTPGGPFWEHKQLWSFPKGHIEHSDKDDENAACREFWEETSCDLRLYEYFDFGIIKQNKHKTVHVFSTYDSETEWEVKDMHCPIKTDMEYPVGSGNIIKIIEISDYKWMTLKEMKNIPFIKVYYPIYQEINDNFEKYSAYEKRRFE